MNSFHAVMNANTLVATTPGATSGPGSTRRSSPRSAVDVGGLLYFQRHGLDEPPERPDIWTLGGFVQAVPLEIEEAAYVDGASWVRTFWSILVPLVAPGVVATSVFAFITAWNEFIFAYTFLQDASKYTVAVGLQRFFGANTADWGPIMAASTLITIPIVIFFVAIQSKLSSGLTVGAVKG